MKFPSSVSKILPPRLPTILPRPRLLQRLAQHRERKLLLIMGPAAQGKTTLAASYVQQSPLPSAWLNLGPEDSEAVNLFYLLGQALQGIFPDVDFSPALAYPSRTMGPREELPLYRDWLLALLQPIAEPVHVVFDGLDRLASNASAWHLLQVLLEVVPPHLHLYLLSRELPPLQIQDLKIRQQAFIMDSGELAFTLKEAGDLLADVRGLALSPGLVKTIHRFTEGWIGGLILLSEALEHYTQISSHLFLREAHLAMALWKWRQGQAEAAAQHLEAGLKLGERHGYHFSFMLNKQDMLQVCLLALELRLEGTWDYVSHILRTRLADLAGPELERLSRHANAKTAHQAREIRWAIHRAGRPRLRLQTLGGFKLWRGEAPLEEERWKGQKPMRLLKALLARGTWGTPKDVLMEDLWPETSQKVAENNFKVFLHRLRKTLETEVDKTFGSSYLHLRANLLTLDQELCQVDVDEFLNLLRQGEQQEGEGREPAALALYKQALAVYRGDFLAEEPYQTWAASRREELRHVLRKELHTEPEMVTQAIIRKILDSP